MKLEEFGNRLEEVIFSASPITLAENNIFNVLMLLLKKVKNEKPEIYQPFVTNVAKKIQKKTDNKSFKKEAEKLSKEISQYENLAENFNLVRLHLNYMIDILGITEEQFWKNEKIAFSSEKFMTSLYVLFYYQVVTLNELLGRQTGIKFYKESIDIYNEIINARNQKDIHENLDTMREESTEWMKINPYGRIRLYSEVKDGQLVQLCRNCEKFTELQKTELVSDKELFYLVLCYMHVPLAKVWNENFVLTLEKSLALGDLYCSYVYTDKRIAKEVKPPSKDYLDEIWLKNK